MAAFPILADPFIPPALALIAVAAAVLLCMATPLMAAWRTRDLWKTPPRWALLRPLDHARASQVCPIPGVCPAPYPYIRATFAHAANI